MPTPVSSMSVAVLDSSAFVKIAGRASFTVSGNFKTLFNELTGRGYHRFVIDLTDCPIMDSTFLGVLAGISTKLDSQEANGASHCMTLLNPNPKVCDLLDNLGVLSVFTVQTGNGQPPNNYQAVFADAPVPTKTETSRQCLEAHRTLMALNPANVAKFQDVTRFLEESLREKPVE